MTTEKHDPWALLRDAREWLGHGLPCATICGECIVIDRIDAALAEHATAKPSPADIKWEEKDSNRLGISPHEADYSDDVFLTAEPHFLWAGWLFRVEYVGTANNETEAKAKAIEYAGRLP